MASLADLLNKSLLINSWGKLFEVDGIFYGLAKAGNKFDVYICFQQGVTNLCDHRLESLLSLEECNTKCECIINLFIERTRSRKVGDGGINPPSQILEHHGLKYVITATNW